MAVSQQQVGAERNYLEEELNALIMSDAGTWQFLQQGSLDGVWYWDLEDTTNEWMSPEFWRTLGVDPATKSHSPEEWQDLIFPEDLTVAIQNFEAHCADPDHPYDQVVRYRHADGSTVWIRCRGLAIRDAAGKPIRMLGAHTDLTAVKRSEESARAGWRAAELANAELRSFAYSVSHDLKAPANTLELLLGEFARHMEHSFDEEGRALFDMCTRTIDRMQRLIEYVLEYTQVIGMEQEREPIALGDAVDHALQNLAADIRKRGAQVTVGALPRITGIRPQMHILFQNLISNAIKYCPAERTPRIDIAMSRDELTNSFAITVRDNGIGIPPENRERIFKIFQRLHAQDEIEGVGLGLPMCQHIALKHHGEIEVASEPGSGSEFSLILPRDILI